jgi:hypothetical protein
MASPVHPSPDCPCDVCALVRRTLATFKDAHDPLCTCTPDETSDGSATYEDDPFCPIHGGRL